MEIMEIFSGAYLLSPAALLIKTREKDEINIRTAEDRRTVPAAKKLITL